MSECLGELVSQWANEQTSLVGLFSVIRELVNERVRECVLVIVWLPEGLSRHYRAGITDETKAPMRRLGNEWMSG